MAKEIERKFLVITNEWRALADEGARYEQAYLMGGKGRSVRVRVSGDSAKLTLKFGESGLSRDEFEYAIPVSDAREMMPLREGNVIDKTRFNIVHEGFVWEVDEFRGALDGLIVAEIELVNESAQFSKPNWLGREVTGEPAYYNQTMAMHGYPEGLSR